MLIFSVYDAAAEAYLPPMFLETKGLAIRVFAEACNDADHGFCKHGADYTLFHIGSFDQLTGILVSITPDSMGNALQYMERPDPAHLALEVGS